jgi:TonB family protein
MRRCWTIVLAVVLAPGLVYAQQATPTADVPVLTSELIAKGITPPELLSNVEAEYSDDARNKHINGLCMVSLIVDIQGNPQNVHIVHCTDSSFEQGSLDAVKQYRFKPAATQEGKPIPVAINVQITYQLNKFHSEYYSSGKGLNSEISALIRYGFIPQRGGVSEPDSNGVYPFTRSVTGPRVVVFSDEGYGRTAFSYEGSGVCDIVLTVSTKGKASDPQVTHCERPELEEPAIKSLLNSEYEPGFVNGEAVPMRASIHLEYGGVSPKP